MLTKITSLKKVNFYCDRKNMIGDKNSLTCSPKQIK